MTADDLQALKRAEQSGNTDAMELLLQQYRRKQSDIFLSISRRNNLVAVRTSDTKTLEEIGKLIRRLDVPTSIGCCSKSKVLSIDLAAGCAMNSAFDFLIPATAWARRADSATATFSRRLRIY